MGSVRRYLGLQGGAPRGPYSLVLFLYIANTVVEPHSISYSLSLCSFTGGRKTTTSTLAVLAAIAQNKDNTKTQRKHQPNPWLQ